MQRLQEQSVEMNTKLFDQAKVDENENLREHLVLLIAAYNRMFMLPVSRDMDAKELKQKFLNGMEKHLNLVNWRYDENAI
jgi:hypothetical protein